MLDPSKSPKALELKSVGEGKKVIVQGIYELNDDRVKIAWANKGERPKAFPTEPKEEIGMMVLKKAKDK